MKVLVSVTLDSEIVEQLRNMKNYSALINGLLKEYFAKRVIDNMSLEQLQKELQIAKIEEEAQKKIEELKNGKS